MRREARRSGVKNIWEDKRVITGTIIASVLAIIVVFFSFYSRVNDNKIGGAKSKQILDLQSEKEIEDNAESASSSIGNTVEQSKTTEVEKENNKTEENKTYTSTNTNTASNNTSKENTTKQNTNTTKSNTVTENKKNAVKETAAQTDKEKSESKSKVAFAWPVKGEILKAFSMDNLLYSATLKEWTTHNGIDIKADKASVVSVSADGVVKTIKNDPRYGLTVTVEHADGFKTVYSNLLTAEFVVEGEKVKQGQNIGTVGNTANFEVAEDFHLHFEILKDSQNVDPMIYLK